MADRLATHRTKMRELLNTIDDATDAYHQVRQGLDGLAAQPPVLPKLALQAVFTTGVALPIPSVEDAAFWQTVLQNGAVLLQTRLMRLYGELRGESDEIEKFCADQAARAQAADAGGQ